MFARWRVLLMTCMIVGAGTSAASIAHAATSTPPSLVSLAVVPCSAETGISRPQPWQPTQLPVVLSKQDAARLTFFSDGYMTVLGPRGWACQALVAGDGSLAIEVYPPGTAPADLLPSPSVPDQSVYAVSDYTGHGPGAQQICAYFPQSAASALLNGGSLPCPALPSGTTTTQLTADAVTFRAVDGRIGLAMYPQLSAEPSGGTTVRIATCRVEAKRSPCATILGDYGVRGYPSVPTS